VCDQGSLRASCQTPRFMERTKTSQGLDCTRIARPNGTPRDSGDNVTNAIENHHEMCSASSSYLHPCGSSAKGAGALAQCSLCAGHPRSRHSREQK